MNTTLVLAGCATQITVRLPDDMVQFLDHLVALNNAVQAAFDLD